MAKKIVLKPSVEFGVVPTHIRFAGGLAPDAGGRLPRTADGRLCSVAELAHLKEVAPVAINAAQVPIFPGLDLNDVEDLFGGIRALGIKPHMIMMVAGGNPMDPADEDTVVGMLVNGLRVAQQFGVEGVASTSIEEWMKAGARPLTGAAFDAALAQVVRVHTRAVREAGALGSVIRSWHIEFLRGTEFQTFTDIGKAWQMVQATNRELGSPFFKVLVDAAHCGDSGLTIEENARVIREMADAGAFSMFHASAKTTRGCLSTDDGWIGALLAACAATGKLEVVLVELFDHEDPALEALRRADPRHGVDTRDGRTYTEALCDGLESVARRLNNLVARGILPAG